MTPDMNVIVASIVLGLAVCLLVFCWNAILVTKQVRTERQNIKKLAPRTYEVGMSRTQRQALVVNPPPNRYEVHGYSYVVHKDYGDIKIPVALHDTVSNLTGLFPDGKVYFVVYANCEYHLDLVLPVAELAEADEVEAAAEYGVLRVHKLRDNAYALSSDHNRYFGLTKKDKEAIAALNLQEGQGVLRAYNCADGTIEWWADDEAPQKYSGSTGGLSRPDVPLPAGAIGPDGVS